MALENRFDEAYDAVLHLLDRQVIDKDGLFVCKVDDLELTETEHGLTATALLAGSPALLPRVSGPAGRVASDYRAKMGDEQADRRLPYRLDFALVEELTSAVTLNVSRHKVLVRAPDPEEREDDEPVRRRLGTLLGFPVRDGSGRAEGKVLDVRLDPEHRVASLRIGKGSIASNLGYDRNERQGPALIRAFVRWLHRHQQEILIGDARIDWEGRAVTILAGRRAQSASG